MFVAVAFYCRDYQGSVLWECSTTPWNRHVVSNRSINVDSAITTRLCQLDVFNITFRSCTHNWSQTAFVLPYLRIKHASFSRVQRARDGCSVLQSGYPLTFDYLCSRRTYFEWCMSAKLNIYEYHKLWEKNVKFIGGWYIWKWRNEKNRDAFFLVGMREFWSDSRSVRLGPESRRRSCATVERALERR